MNTLNLKTNIVALAVIFSVVGSTVGIVGLGARVRTLEAENEAMLELFEQVVETDELLVRANESQNESTSLIFDSVLNLQRKVSELGIDYLDLQIQFMHCYLNDFNCTLAGDG